MDIIIPIFGSLLVGMAVSYFVFNNLARTKAKAIINQAKKDSEQIKKEKLLQAKEKFLELKSDHEKVINNKNNELAKSENRIKKH